MPREEITRNQRSKKVLKASKMDCWNCGSRSHHKSECPRSSTPRCSICDERKQNCKCKKGDALSRNICKTHFDSVFEAAILLNIEGRRVRAVVNTGHQETRIGEGVLVFLQENRHVNLGRQMIRTPLGIETLRATVVHIGCGNRMFPIECFVDNRVPSCEIILGFQAMITLGYKLYVGGLESRQRQKFKETNHDVNEPSKKRKLDEEIIFLDHREAKRRNEWFD